MASKKATFRSLLIVIVVSCSCYWKLYEFGIDIFNDGSGNYEHFALEKSETMQTNTSSYDCNLKTEWDLPSEINNISAVSNVTTLSPLFNRLIDDKYAIFCSSGYKPEGTGNALAIYWTARAMAFFMDWTFVMNDNYNKHKLGFPCRRKRKFPMFDQIKYPRMKWTWFLKMRYKDTLSSNCKQNTSDIASKYNKIWRYYTMTDEKLYSVPYWTHLFFLVYNPWFAQIIQADTHLAFEQFYSFNQNDDEQRFDDHYWIDRVHTNMDFYNSVMTDLKDSNLHIIVIHIRCSDLLYHRKRYLMNMKYFELSLDAIFDHIKTHNKGINDMDKTYKIQIISQLDATNIHTDKDLMALPLSNKIVFFMIDEIEKYISTKYDIDYKLEVIGNGTTDNDYFQMATARYLLCSPSAFCLMAAIANYFDPQLIILPQIGKWGLQGEGYLNVSQNANGGILSHHKWVNTDSLWTQIKSVFDTDSLSSQNLTDFKEWFVKK